MSLRLGDMAPNFHAETTDGVIDFHEWIDGGWCILFSHPKDFTPVCTTELGDAAERFPVFQDRGCKLIGLSVDTVADHKAWMTDIRIATGRRLPFPLIGDPTLNIAKLYDMLPALAGDSVKGRTAADNRTVRSVFFIAPDKAIRAILTYPMTTGRDFGEVLRLLDSLQLTERHEVATPAGWSSGDDVIIAPSVSNEEAEKIYSRGWRAPLPYLRFVQCSPLGEKS